MSAKDLLEFFFNAFKLRLRSWERFIRFCIVGGSGVLVNTSILWLLSNNMDYKVASVFAIEIAIIWNFILNNHWTFKKSTNKSSWMTKLVKFNAVSIIGAIINWSILVVFTEYVGVHFLLSNIIGIIVATAWNYLVNSTYTWRDL